MTDLAADLQLALDPARVFTAAGLTPEPWQLEILRTRPRRALLCCCRQAGKSSTAAASAVHEALYTPCALCLMLAPSQRQSSELLREARRLLTAAAPSQQLRTDQTTALELANGSRIVSLPARDDTIRGFAKVALLIIDEAAWVDDDVYHAALPMLAISNGRLLALSTPNGQRGWFYRAWTTNTTDWHRTRITGSQCPRISPEYLTEARNTLTPTRYASEYDCQFTDADNAVFPAATIQAALNPDLDPLYPEGW